jgi:hypothetical protein
MRLSLAITPEVGLSCQNAVTILSTDSLVVNGCDRQPCPRDRHDLESQILVLLEFPGLYACQDHWFSQWFTSGLLNDLGLEACSESHTCLSYMLLKCCCCHLRLTGVHTNHAYASVLLAALIATSRTATLLAALSFTVAVATALTSAAGGLADGGVQPTRVAPAYKLHSVDQQLVSSLNLVKRRLHTSSSCSRQSRRPPSAESCWHTPGRRLALLQGMGATRKNSKRSTT